MIAKNILCDLTDPHGACLGTPTHPWELPIGSSRELTFLFFERFQKFQRQIMGQIFCSRGRPLENSRGRPVDFTGRPVNSTGRPLEFSRGRPVKFFIAFLDEIGNSKSFEANLQNSSGRPVGFLEDVQ